MLNMVVFGQLLLVLLSMRVSAPCCYIISLLLILFCTSIPTNSINFRHDFYVLNFVKSSKEIFVSEFQSTRNKYITYQL